MPHLETLINKDGTIVIIIKDIFSQIDQKYVMRWLSSLNYTGRKSYDHTDLDREQIWYHHDASYFCDKWKRKYDRWIGHKYPLYLRLIQKIVLENTKKIIDEYGLNLDLTEHNSCLINKYENGTDNIRPHRDSEYAFGDEPTIIGLSMGQKRQFILSSKTSQDTMEFTLDHNSIFVMAGRSQLDWYHSIPPDDTTDVRYSLTFRHHIKHEEEET